MTFIEADIHFTNKNCQTMILGDDIFLNNSQIKGYWVDVNVYVCRIPNKESLWKVIYFDHDNIVKINEYYSKNIPLLEEIKHIINNGDEDRSIWEGKLPYREIDSKYNLEKINVIDPSELYATLPASWNVKSLIPYDPSSIETFKECANFSLANTEWLNAERKRLDAVLNIRRKIYELEADLFILTCNNTNPSNELVIYENKSKLFDIQLKRIKNGIYSIQFPYIKINDIVTINIHSMTFCKCCKHFIGLLFCILIIKIKNLINYIFNRKHSNNQMK
jgi:hypothetical protein